MSVMELFHPPGCECGCSGGRGSFDVSGACRTLNEVQCLQQLMRMFGRQGVTDGSPAMPGEIGENIFWGSNNTQTAITPAQLATPQPGFPWLNMMIPAGDWDTSVAWEFECSPDVVYMVCNLSVPSTADPNFGNANHIGSTDDELIPNSVNLHSGTKPLLLSAPALMTVYVACWAASGAPVASARVAANVSLRRMR